MSDAPTLIAPASDRMLETVTGIMQSVLQGGRVGADDNFFDLGGDSMLAIQLFAELERVTGRSLPITTIYDAPTASALTALLAASAEQPAFSPLVLMNDAPGQPPLFIVHGIGGNVMELGQLCRSIEAERRVLAIQARGLDGVEQPIGNIQEMAAYYLAAVRREQPEGPYLLLGYSFGGMVVLEMARLIEAAGQVVGFLGFIDAYPHPNFWPRLSWLDVRWRRAAQGVFNRLGRAWAMLGPQGGGLKRKRGPNAIVRPFKFDEDWPEAVKLVYDTSLAALAQYTPCPYAGSVVFFQAATRSFYLPNSPRRMWGSLLGHLDVVTAPGDHVDMVGVYASTLGASIAGHIHAGLDRVARSETADRHP